MQHFPIFLALAGRRVVLAGGGDAALAKLRLLLKTQAHLTVIAPAPAPEIKSLAQQGKIRLIERAQEPGDALCASLFYAAHEDDARDATARRLAQADGALTNTVDDLHNSQFITPAIVDRDPVTVAIGTEGAAPVVARAIKRDLEERLPTRLGTLARIGKTFRAAADALPMGRKRRDFWADFYFGKGPKALETSEDAVQETLETLLDAHLNAPETDGHVDFVGAGPGDPELLTLKARKALDKADVVIYDRLIAPEILELCRREAVMIEAGKTGFGPSMAQDDINTLITDHARQGAHVVRLKSGDAAVFGRLEEELDAVEAQGIPYTIVPGITAAAGAMPAMGRSLTRRDRNAGVRILTGHDMQGFADHDWRALAKPGEVAAIYMGKRAAHFTQGRLMMHGAAASTPVTAVENVSRASQRVVECRLGTLSQDLEHAALSGPTVLIFGLAPRRAALLSQHLPREAQA